MSNEVSAIAADIPEELWKRIAVPAGDGDYFGVSVYISGDYAVAGAVYKVSDVFYRGAAYIYALNEGGTDNWGEVAKLIASNPQNDVLFGYSIAISGDYVVVGALLKDDFGTDRGAIYIF